MDARGTHKVFTSLTEKLYDAVIFHQEDAMLIRLVEEVGILRWSDISKQFQHRNGKQCSERYKNYCYE